MNEGRWYPTTTTLASGDVLVLSGSEGGNCNDKNLLPQIWKTRRRVWRDLDGAQEVEPLGVDLYPRMFVGLDGPVFKAAPDRDTWYLDTRGRGTWTRGPVHTFPHPRTYGSAVMYDTGKVLVVGGGDPPTATAEIIDLNSPTPTWENMSAMAFPRRQHNATILPDGTVLVTGGSSGPGFSDETRPVFAAELWDPVTKRWSTLASMLTPRLYHSTALLLPDGRVLSAGGGEGDNDPPHPDGELYSPPYLFRGARPRIDSAPRRIRHGRTFLVRTPDAASITKVSLIRLPAVTHAFDQSQRFISLAFSRVGEQLEVTGPPHGNVSPPGPYMLFIVNDEGVPSVARIIQVKGGSRR
jgi:hypothetical protein